jgi:hypothetical protein
MLKPNRRITIVNHLASFKRKTMGSSRILWITLKTFAHNRTNWLSQKMKPTVSRQIRLLLRRRTFRIITNMRTRLKLHIKVRTSHKNLTSKTRPSNSLNRARKTRIFRIELNPPYRKASRQ